MFKLLLLLVCVAYASAGGLYSGYGLGYGSSYGYGSYGLGHGLYSPYTYPLATSYANVYKVPPSVTKFYPGIPTPYTKIAYASPVITKLGYLGSSYYGNYPYSYGYGYPYYTGYSSLGHGYSSLGHGYSSLGHGYGGYGYTGYGGYYGGLGHHDYY